MPHSDPEDEAKGDHRYPTYTTGRLGLSLAPKPLSLGTTSGSPSFGLRASLHMPPLPPPATGSVHFGVPGQASQADASAGVGRAAGTPTVPLESVKERKRERDAWAPPKEQPDFGPEPADTDTASTYSSRPRRIQLPDRAQTTTPTMPRGNYTSRNAPPARRRNEPAHIVGRRGRTQTTIPTMPRGTEVSLSRPIFATP